VIKPLASFMLSLCFCVPVWAERTVVSVDSNAIEQEIRNAVRDLRIQIPELPREVRVKIQMSEIQVQIPEIRVDLPEILIPAIRLQVPVNVHIPEYNYPKSASRFPE
jgi:hypothetical protein